MHVSPGLPLSRRRGDEKAASYDSWASENRKGTGSVRTARGALRPDTLLAASTCLLICVALVVYRSGKLSSETRIFFGLRKGSQTFGASSLVQQWPVMEAREQLGLSEGNYSLLDGSTCVSCVHRIHRLCGFRISGTQSRRFAWPL